MTQGGEETGQEDTDATDRARVRRLLIDRVEAAGLVRARAVTAEAQKAMLNRLADHLAYMTGENLQTLAELLIDNPGLNPPQSWPSEVMIRQFARSLQVPPVRERRIVTSWLASVEGPVAEAGGYLVELYRFLLRHGRPPLDYDLRQVRETSAENNRRCVLIRDRIARDVATAEDRLWLEAYVRDQAETRRILDAGQARRAAKGEGVAA